MAQPKKPDVSKNRQQKLIERLKKKEYLMKWILIIAGIIILLLLLYVGYATDWMRGLKNTSASVSPNLDSATTAQDTAGTGTESADTGGTNGGGSTASTTSNTTTGGGGGTNTNSTSNNTTRESTSNTTNNNTTTTTNNTTTQEQAKENALLSLYSDANVGDTLHDILSQATSLGIQTDCTDALLIRTCTLTAGDVKVQIRGLLSTGLVTSVLRLL